MFYTKISMASRKFLIGMVVLAMVGCDTSDSTAPVEENKLEEPKQYTREYIQTLNTNSPTQTYTVGECKITVRTIYYVTEHFRTTYKHYFQIQNRPAIVSTCPIGVKMDVRDYFRGEIPTTE